MRRVLTISPPPPPENSRDNEPISAATAANLIIHADNLLALKALLPRYAGRVKCVYIDPPYNTGSQSWVYNDNVNSPLLREWLGKVVDQEDLSRHDKWLCMMWPRLQLLRELLREDGVIFISIDDHEQHRLRGILDEIFGEENFITNIIWRKKTSPQNDARYFSDNHDFVVVYAKNKINWKLNPLPRTPELDEPYRYDDGDGRGRYTIGDLSVRTYSPEYDFPIQNPNTGEMHQPPQGRCWRAKEETVQKWLAENRIAFGKDGKGRPQLKRYLKDVKKGVTPLTIWDAKDVGSTSSATKHIKEIFPDHKHPFNTAKPVQLIQRILQIATAPDDIVLDSFAGSGTTAHAVLALNQEDGGTRKFILVECEEYADRITTERVRRVIRGLPDAAKPALRAGLGGDFAFHTLGPPLTIDGLLQGDELPPFATLAAHLLYTASGQAAPAPTTLQPQDEDGFFQTAAGVDYYLLYEPCLDYLRSNAAVLNEERAGRIQKRNQERGRRAVVFAAAKYIGQRKLTQMGITFCQLPYEIQAPPAEDNSWS